MNAPERLPPKAQALAMADVQSLPDARDMAIDAVGIRGLRHPITVTGRDGGKQATVAEFQLTVGLPPEVKGTHMSRLVELVDQWQAPLNAASLRGLGALLLERLGASQGEIDISFPYFIRKHAPVSGLGSLLDYQAGARVSATAGAPTTVSLSLRTAVTSLCPCSREISEYGAHNQRSHIVIEAELASSAAGLSLEDLARTAEEAASCEIWGILKRPDEKYVTERAYDNPRFVEDLVREVAMALDRNEAVAGYRVEVENFESIHNHSACARITRRK